MAQIPYGYKIENGEAKPEPDKVQKLNAFIDAYLGGLSFKEARKTSGVELSESCLRDYMRNGTFAGTDYYPPIVPEGTLERDGAKNTSRRLNHTQCRARSYQVSVGRARRPMFR